MKISYKLGTRLCKDCDKPRHNSDTGLCELCQNIVDQRKMAKTSNIGIPMDVLDRDRERRINDASIESD